MKNWKTILLTDYPNLSDTNHIINLRDKQELAKIYNAVMGKSGPTLKFTKEFKVSGNPTALYSERGDLFKYAVHVSSAQDMYWELVEDYLLRRQTLSGLNILEYNTGYINGTVSPYGSHKGFQSASMIPGYVMWMEITIQTMPALVGEHDI
jgi:hypothetical protein